MGNYIGIKHYISPIHMYIAFEIQMHGNQFIIYVIEKFMDIMIFYFI